MHGGLSELGDRLGPLLWQFSKFRRFERDDFATFHIANGYPGKEIADWARRAHLWARGGLPEDLPYLQLPSAVIGNGKADPGEASPTHAAPTREVFVYFIGAAKVRNPAAAMALQKAVGSSDWRSWTRASAEASFRRKGIDKPAHQLDKFP